MSSSDVSAVTSHFPTPNEGFITTISGAISSGATTVPLSSITNLVNATVFTGIIEPGLTNEQTFTGIVDTSGLQITGVKWTRGTNIGHAGGVSVVDYVTGTAIKMITKGLLVSHDQDGTLAAGAVDNAAVLASNVVTSSKISGLDKSNLTTDSNPYKFSAYQAGSLSVSSSTLTKAQLDTELFDTNSNFDSTTNYRYTAPVTGYYWIVGQISLTTAGANSGVAMTGSLRKNGTTTVIDGSIVAASGSGNMIPRVSMVKLLALTAGDYLELMGQINEGSRAIQGGEYETFMSGFLVCRT
jgi:hypothetical protein